MKMQVLTPKKQKIRLGWILLMFFLSLSIPVYYLLQTVYVQLEKEAYFTIRHQAETLVDQLELNLQSLLKVEQNRPIAEYSFFNVMANPLLSETTGVKFSPLSELPPKTEIKGLKGYFQINTDGSFHLPALPEIGMDNHSGLSLQELSRRLVLKDQLSQLLSKKIKTPHQDKVIANKPNALTEGEEKEDKVSSFALLAKKNQSEPLKPSVTSAGFRASASLPEYKIRKETVQLPDQSMASRYFNSSIDSVKAVNRKPEVLSKQLSDDRALFRPTLVKKNKKKWEPLQEPIKARRIKSLKRLNTFDIQQEIIALPEQPKIDHYFKRPKESTHSISPRQERVKDQQILKPSVPEINIVSFESEVTPLQLLLIAENYLCFYRYVWHDEKRYTQGFIVHAGLFLDAVSRPFALSPSFSRLLFLEHHQLLHSLSVNSDEQGYSLYKRTLSAPFQNMVLQVNALPMGEVPGSLLIDLLALSIYGIFMLGFIAFYRLGSRQIDLAKQQQNFISAVSHELKTPLTSIRMYAEMLRSEWVADEAKKQDYYDFIFFESERLSRLINNVLQFTRIGQHQQPTENIMVSAERLFEKIPSKVKAQIESSGFQLNILPSSNNNDIKIKVDEDAFFQVIINLMDNAIKFSANSSHTQVDIGLKVDEKRSVVTFFIRDYGVGIKSNQLKKIFKLFYRAGDELTRTTPGTGIGLALVTQLVASMNAKIGVYNKKPGAEFQIKFVGVKNEL